MVSLGAASGEYSQTQPVPSHLTLYLCSPLHQQTPRMDSTTSSSTLVRDGEVERRGEAGDSGIDFRRRDITLAKLRFAAALAWRTAFFVGPQVPHLMSSIPEID